MGQAGTMVLGILFNAALGRTLGAGDFGLYFLINSFASFALVLVDWGQQYFGIREVARAPERGADLLGTGLVLRGVGTLLIAVPAGLTAWALGYDLRTLWFSVAFIIANLPFFLAQGFGIVFRGRDRMGLDAIVAVANRAVGLLLALAVLGLGFGLGGVVVAQALAGAAALAVAGQLYRRVSERPLQFSLLTAREILTGGTAIVTMSIAVYTQPYIDAVLLSKLVPKDAVGWYGAAKTIMGTLLAPSLILGSAAFPRLSRATRDLSVFRAELATAQRPMLWLGGLVGVGTWLFADVAINVVYGQRHFGPAGAILKVFGLGLFLVFIDMLIAAALTALGRAPALAVAKVGSVVLGVALELVFIPHFQLLSGNGGIGVTLAFALSELVMFAAGLWLMPRGTVGSAVFIDGARALGCALLTALPFLWLPPMSPWVGIPLCIILFTLCSAACGLLRRGDLQVVQALFRRGAITAESVAVAETSGGSRLE
jgi:PST family polysaccharide transporter